MGCFGSAAVKTDGTLWAWGINAGGRVGDGTIVNKSSPVQVGSDTNWAYVSTSDSATLAVKTNGTLWAWGGNTQGQLGDGTNINKSSPIQIGSLSTWYRVTEGPLGSFGLST